MSFDPGMLHNNGHTAYANGSGPGIRETGVVEKLLTSYGFIQCSERQARLFFHCSQYNGNLQELKIGGEGDLLKRNLLDFLLTLLKLRLYLSFEVSSFSFLFVVPFSVDDVEFEVSSDRRTGKPIAVKLLKIKPEVLPEERISGQVGPDLHAYPFTVLHGYIHPVKEYHFIFGYVLVCQLSLFILFFGASSVILITVKLVSHPDLQFKCKLKTGMSVCLR